MSEHASLPIFDGHNDVLHKLHERNDQEGRSFLNGSSAGHLDLPRAERANFRGGLFAVYPPNPASVPSPQERLTADEKGYEVEIAPPLEVNYAYRLVDEMITIMTNLENQSQGTFRRVSDIPGLKSSFNQRSITAVLHLEGAEALHPSLKNLDDLYRRGVRSLGITWSRENAFGFGVPFQIPSSPDIGPGLKPPGRALVKACNQLGIMIDLAHLNEKGFWDVAALSDAPLVSSHTAAHALTPRSRNLTDDQLRAIQESGGLVGVTFSVNDLDGGRRPKKDAPLSALIRHIRYLSELIGVDHVAFGSDLDGTVIPSQVGDVTGFPQIIKALHEAGFSNKELKKISHLNWLRVLEDTWQNSP